MTVAGGRRAAVVVDASVLATALLDDGPDGAALRERLARAGPLAAPELIDLEVASVWRRTEHRGAVIGARVRQALRDLADLPIERFGHLALLPRIWALRANVTPYDAAYIALAELLDCSLLSGDRRLAQVPGITCEVEVPLPLG